MVPGRNISNPKVDFRTFLAVFMYPSGVSSLRSITSSTSSSFFFLVRFGFVSVSSESLFVTVFFFGVSLVVVFVGVVAVGVVLARVEGEGVLRKI